MLQQPRVQRTSGAWFELAEPAAAAPMHVNQASGWAARHAAPDLTPGEEPGSAKRARVEHMSTPAFSEQERAALALLFPTSRIAELHALRPGGVRDCSYIPAARVACGQQQTAGATAFSVASSSVSS